MIDVETLIVGGGPAGSTCAWELRRRGREALILERQALPKSKLCAGWITPEVLRDLELCEREYPHGLLALDRIRLYLGRSRWSVTFPARQFSIRRVELDNWLLARCGAPVERWTAREIRSHEGGFVVDGRYRCRFLVGAGGTSCPVRRALFGPDDGPLVLTQEVEFPADARGRPCTLFYPYLGSAGYAWYVPKAGAVNVGFGAVASQAGGNIKAHWEGFGRLLVERGLLESPPPAPASHPYRVAHRPKPVRRGSAFLAGDAAGLASGDLGEGIGPAVESGLRAAREIAGAPAGPLAPRRLSLRGAAGLVMAGLVARAGRQARPL